MQEATNLSRPQTLRVRAAALWMGLLSACYGALCGLYFYHDVFVHWGERVTYDTAGVGFHIQGSLWTYLSWWRPGLALLAVGMLGASAVALWRGTPRARLLSLLTLWGVLLPQTAWFTEYLADWHEGKGIATAVAGAVSVAAVPTALLWGRNLLQRFEGRDMLTGWATLSYGRGRLLASAMVLSWMGFGAASFMDHAYRLPSDLAYFGALMTLGLSAVAVAGIMRLRAWALWVGVAATLTMALVPLAALWTPYEPNLGWHINSVVTSLAGSDLQRAMLALVPLSILWMLAGPFLQAFWSKARR